jgi:N-methylhydantoinase B/oxoprolinase/acetone carboxylase alpha subunit
MSHDPVDLKILQNQLVNICQEMAMAMMRTAYSPIFSESLDFCTILFDREGEMIAMADMNPAMLGSAALSGRWIIDELGPDSFEPGDVVVDNDPYRGMCHMPEHLLLAPFFHRGELEGFVGNVGHVGEIGGKAPGSFAADATEIYQEGLRLPPVKLMRRGEYAEDIWKIMLANHRTPDTSWGDFNAMVGSLTIGQRRLEALYASRGPRFVREAVPALYEYAESWLRNEIRELPNGAWEASDVIEDDGVVDGAYTIRVRVVVQGDEVIIDFTGTDAQAKGPINAPYTVTFAAACNGFFQLFREFPLNSGTFRPLRVIAPAGSLLNVLHPGPCVAGQTEIQPRVIDLIQGGCLGQVVPERVAAAGGGTCSNFLIGGVHPRTRRYYTHYHFDGMGWGGRHASDGNSACNAPHSNCPNTPIEVFESRFPFRHVTYRLRRDSGGAGRQRGGLGIEREFEVLADEVQVSALYERMTVAPWGLAGGGPGARTELLVRQSGTTDYLPFGDVFETASPSKFTNVILRRGDRVVIRTAGGGGYGVPSEREPEEVARDLEEGWISQQAARVVYGEHL